MITWVLITGCLRTGRIMMVLWGTQETGEGGGSNGREAHTVGMGIFMSDHNSFTHL